MKSKLEDELNKAKYNLTTHEVNMIIRLFSKLLEKEREKAFQKGWKACRFSERNTKLSATGIFNFSKKKG